MDGQGTQPRWVCRQATTPLTRNTTVATATKGIQGRSPLPRPPPPVPHVATPWDVHLFQLVLPLRPYVWSPEPCGRRSPHRLVGRVGYNRHGQPMDKDPIIWSHMVRVDIWSTPTILLGFFGSLVFTQLSLFHVYSFETLVHLQDYSSHNQCIIVLPTLVTESFEEPHVQEVGKPGRSGKSE